MGSECYPQIPLGSLVDIYDSIRIPVKKTDRKPGPYPYYGASGIVDYVDSYIFDGEYLLLAEDGENLRSRNLPIAFMAKGKFWVNNHAHILRGKHGNNTRYLCYALKVADIGSHLSGSTRPKLTQGDMKRIPVSCPTEEQQRAIAHILGSLDDKIELNRQMNQTLEKMAQAIFKSWFIDFDPVVWNAVKTGKPVPERFAETAARYQADLSAVTSAKAEGRDSSLPKEIADLFPDSFEDSELGEIPKGWEVASLYNTAIFINGAAFKNEHFCERLKGLPVIKIAELKNGISAQTKYSERKVDPKYHINTGDLLYSWSGSPGTSLAAFIWTRGRGLLNQHIFKVVTKSDAQKRFVYYLLKQLRSTLIAIARNKQTTGLGHVTVADMKRLIVCKAPGSVLSSLNEMVGPIYDLCFSNELESEILSKKRDTLLPKLISGELPISDAEKFIAEAGI